MTIPDSVPARAYLLAYDVDRERLTGRTWLGYTLRAAALADLFATGHLTDVDGRPHAGSRRPADPVLAAVWKEISDDKPRSWERWVGRGRGEIDRAVRAQLVAARVIRVTREPTWLRTAKIEITDPRARTRLDARVGAALRGPTPVNRLDPRDAALVAVLVIGEVRAGVSRTQKREYATRVAAMVARGGPPMIGLKRALRAARSSAS